MATLLLPPFPEKESFQPRWAYASILTDIVRASSDGIEALTLFRALLLGQGCEPGSIGFMGFDAHGGDTGCQLRAGMLREIFVLHRQFMVDPETNSLRNPDWIDEYLDRLQTLNESAKDACFKLTHKRIMPSKLGFDDKRGSSQGILAALGWSEAVPQTLYGRPTSYCPQDEIELQDDDIPNAKAPPVSDVNKSEQASKRTSLKRFLKHQVFDVLARIFSLKSARPASFSIERDATSTDAKQPPEPQDPSSSDSTPVSTSLRTSAAVSSSATSVSDLSSTVESPLLTKWDIWDPTILVRFLIYSYILSKYKQFCCLSSVVGARICPEMAVSVGVKLIQPYLNSKNTDYKILKIPRYKAEFGLYQTWLSDFSCAWLLSLAARSVAEPNLEKLLMKTIQKSAKNLTAVACYPGYLLLRETWARERCTMILIDRYYCCSGYHINLYYATLNWPQSSLALYPPTADQGVRWTLKPTTISELLSSSAQSIPHLIVMGNSIDGDYAEYFARASASTSSDGRLPETSCTHADTNCPLNIAHCKLFASTDHDRLTLAFFAAHKLYAFPLESSQLEEDFFEACLDKFDVTRPSGKGTGLKGNWQASRQDAEEMGSGHGNLKVFGIQHIALETKARIAKIVLIAEKEGYLLPLRADVPV